MQTWLMDFIKNIILAIIVNILGIIFNTIVKTFKNYKLVKKEANPIWNIFSSLLEFNIILSLFIFLPLISELFKNLNISTNIISFYKLILWVVYIFIKVLQHPFNIVKQKT